MSQTTNTTGDSEQSGIRENNARIDLCQFLSERSAGLPVQFERIQRDDGTTIERPVARTINGDKADVSDFPSGKDDTDGNFSQATFTRYRDVVSDFIESQDVSDFMQVESRDISRWLSRLHQRGLADTTVAGKLQTLETFLRHMEREEKAPTDGIRLSEKVKGKRNQLGVSASDKSRAGDENHRLDQDRADEILADLARFDYASRRMVEFLLIYRIGCRQSALLSLNVGHLKSDRGVITIRNRPEQTGVRLKKGNTGERDVNVSDDVVRIIETYIEENRNDPKDGSDALLTSAYGRIDSATLYRDITGLTMCEECAETRTKQEAHKCDDSRGPHDIRRTAVTRFRDLGMSWDTIAGRVGSTVEMLKSHYDSPTHAQAAERREAEVRRLLDERPPG